MNREAIRVIVFASDRRRPGPGAFAEGLARAGIDVLQLPPKYGLAVEPVDAIVTDGAKGPAGEIIGRYRSAGTPVWIMELPRLRNNPGAGFRALTEIHGLYLNSLHYLAPVTGNTAIAAGLIADRRGEYVLVCGQKPGDAAHGMNIRECEAWGRRTVERARALYRLPVLYRPHPETLAWFPYAETFGADAVSWPGKETIAEALRRSYALVTYNSTAGIAAIDGGVPALYTASRGEVCWHEYGIRFGGAIKPLPPERREECLLRLAASQWMMDQLRDGTTARCLFRGAAWPAPRIVTLSPREHDAKRAESLAFARSLGADAARMAKRRALIEQATVEAREEAAAAP